MGSDEQRRTGLGRNSVGRAALPIDTVREVKRLLDFGYNRNEAARVAGVDWRSADKIACGCHAQQLNEEVVYQRCGECGGLVEFPCRLCAVRAQQARQTVDLPRSDQPRGRGTRGAAEVSPRGPSDRRQR